MGTKESGKSVLIHVSDEEHRQSFKSGQIIEKRSREFWEVYLSKKADDVVWHDNDILFQKTKGDVSFRLKKYRNTARENTVYNADIKAELKNPCGNFFIEEYSNLRKDGNSTPGWLLTLETDFILYHFIESGEAYILNFPKLKDWVLINKNNLKQKPQSKYAQKNLSIGYLVPIRNLLPEDNIIIKKIDVDRFLKERHG